MATAGHNIQGKHTQKSQSYRGKLTRPTELGDASSLHNLPLGLLHAELQRRQEKDYGPSCGTNGVQGSYNLPLHVFALFLILILSTLGQCAACEKCVWTLI
jgi:hypothetical protein